MSAYRGLNPQRHFVMHDHQKPAVLGMQPRKCARASCETIFKPNRSAQQFCSGACMHAANSEYMREHNRQLNAERAAKAEFTISRHETWLGGFSTGSTCARSVHPFCRKVAEGRRPGLLHRPCGTRWEAAGAAEHDL